jgi:Tol biopolymer transport system component
MRKLALLVLLLLLNGRALHAQNTLLVGPLVAVTTSQQDEIILYDVGSSTQRSLSFGSGWHNIWDFSPDGCSILFTVSDGIAPARLYTARLDGSEQRELVQFSALPDPDWGVWEPQWSPDGQRIVFTMIRNQPQRDGTKKIEYHIGWVTPGGGEPQFYSVTGSEHYPQWSPDGQWLAYVSNTERVPGETIYATAAPTPTLPEGQPTPDIPLLNEGDLWVVSADAATKYQLTNFQTGSVREPRWSPDGELISFIFSPSPVNDQFWMIANSNGAIATQLSFQWSLILDSTWLPDSTAILASVRDFHETQENKLWTIPLVGNADTDAALYLDDPSVSYADYPRFSADGRWLALRSAYGLTLLDTANRSWTRLDETAIGNTPPIWSPAGFTGEASCP